MDYKDYLDTTVLQEKKSVTYRSLARTLNIHVNTAKQALYQYSTVESSVIAVFCLTGTLADHSFSIRLVNQDDLEDAKKLYRHVSGIHVYSILPSHPKDFSVLVMANKDMVEVSVEDRIKNGLIFNSSVKTNAQTSSIPVATASSSSKAPTTSTPSPTKNTTEKKSLFGSTSTNKPTTTTTVNTTTKSSSTTPMKRKGTLSFEKATPAKKQETEKPKSPSSTMSTNRKIRVIQESEDEDEDEEEDEEALDERLARSAKIEVNDIFSDDDEELDAETSNKNHGDSTSTTAPSAMDIDADNGDYKSDNDSNKMDQDENSDQEKEAAPGKVRRKVQKKKTYKNERGFLVTEDVWEWEEVDAETPTTEKTSASFKPKTATEKTSSSAPKKPSTPKKAPGEQKSLLSFWGKR